MNEKTFSTCIKLRKLNFKYTYPYGLFKISRKLKLTPFSVWISIDVLIHHKTGIFF